MHKVARLIVSIRRFLASSPEAITSESWIDTFSKVNSAHVFSSIVLKVLKDTPSAVLSTSTKDNSPFLTQETITFDAFLPFNTRVLVPLSLLSSDKFVSGFKYSYEWAASAYARDTCIEPEQIPSMSSTFPSKLDLSKTEPAKTTLDKYGSITSDFPNSSNNIESSIGPKPKPPDSSEKGIDNQPCSANSDQAFASKSFSDFTTSSLL